MLREIRPIPRYNVRVFGELILGVYDGLRGALYLVTHPRLWIWVLAPAIGAAILLITVIGGTLTALSGPITALVAFLPGHWADKVLELLVGAVLTIASISIFISIAALIAGPFNEELSERLEEQETGVPAPRFRFWRFLYDLVIGIIHAARRVLVYLVVMGFLLVLGVVVPGVGTTAAAVLGFIATARFASYDAYDAVWSRRHYRYKQKTKYLDDHRWRSLGLGAAVALPLIVPGLNVVALAIGATGATLRMIEEDRSRASAATAAATRS